MTSFGNIAYVERGAGDAALYLDRTFPRSQGIRRVPGAKLFFPEELPDLIAEEALRLWRDD